MMNFDKRIAGEIGGGLAVLLGGFFAGRFLIINAGKKGNLGFDENGALWTKDKVEKETKKKELDLNKVQEILDADSTGTMTAEKAKEKVIENQVNEEIEVLKHLGNIQREVTKQRIANELKEKEAKKAAKKKA